MSSPQISTPEQSEHSQVEGESQQSQVESQQIPKTEKTNEHINLKVVPQDGNEVVFKLKMTTTLKKLMAAYCSRNGQTMDGIRFTFNGRRITESDTPEELEMEDEDIIDVIMTQVGG